MKTNELVFLWGAVLLCNAAALALTLAHYRNERKRNPELKIHFRLTDFWAATLGITPSLMIFSAMMKETDRTPLFAPAVLALLAPHQLACMFMMTVEGEKNRTVLNTSPLKAFLQILGGALLGLMMPMFTAVAATMMAVALSLVILTFPFSLIAIGIAFAVYWSRRSRRASAQFPEVTHAVDKQEHQQKEGP